MKVNIKRVDKALPLPVYESTGAVGFDFLCRESKVIQPKTLEFIPLNAIIKIPSGYMLKLAPRGSTFRKKGLIVPNSIGVIDQDYHGDDDEIRLQVYNLKDKPVEVERGEKICQGIFVRIETVEWEETDEKMGETRGGFGSTDSK